MTKRITVRALAVAALYAGFGLNSALALPPAPKAEEMAAVQPKQAGVDVAAIAPADAAKCRVEPFPNAQAPVGYMLVDAGGRPLRRFVAAGTPNFNILSFYQDGEEVYRETDTKSSGKVDQFRWLGAAGSKIGRDLDGNGSIDVWDAISPEEIGKELFDAVLAKDANRLKSLMATEAELKSLGLPTAEIAKYQARMANAGQRFNATVQQAALTAKSKWVHGEFQAPQTTPADALGATQDIVRHRNGGVLYEKGDGKSVDYIQTGELLRVGGAWRVIEGPAAGMPQLNGGGPATVDVPAAVQPLINQLVNVAANDHMGRAAILEKICKELTGNPGQETWMRQMIDAYGSAAESGNKDGFKQLSAWKEQIEKHAPKTPLAGFATFRHLSVDYFLKLNDKAQKPNEVQKWWRDELEKFIAAYPNIEETPEALFRLGMAHEFNGKDGDKIAAGHFAELVKRFPNHPQAPMATGAVNRLGSEGKPFNFVGCTTLANQPFAPAAVAGKAVLVYFWSSYSAQNGKLKEDADFLSGLAKKHAGKLEIVTIALDAPPQQADAAIKAAGLPGTHLVSPNGQMPTAWGVMGQHLFLVDKAGNVDNKNASIPMVGEEVEKLVK